MKIKLGIIIALAAMIGVSMYIRLTKNRSPKSTNTFVIGTVAGYAPFVSINERGEYEGFDIDVAQALAVTMGKELIIKDLGSMTSLFIALEQGSIDAIIWALSITNDRLKKVAMVRYQGENVTSYPLMFWQTIPTGITSIDDMRNMTVCVEPASSQDAVLNRYSFITKLPTEKVDDALLNIQYGKANAAFVEPAIAKKFKAKYPEIETLDIPLSADDQVHGIGIAIKKTNTSLIDTVQTAVAALEQDDAISSLEKKWDIA